MGFKLDSRLAADSVLLGTLGLFQIRLSKDRRFPWIIVVPELNNIIEMTDLSFEQQSQLLQINGQITRMLLEQTHADKINIGNLGNLVSQFHWHIVARSKQDVAWPGPIWGFGLPEPMTVAEQQTSIVNWQARLAKLDGFIGEN